MLIFFFKLSLLSGVIIIIPSYWSVMLAIDVASAFSLLKVSVSIYLGCGRLLGGGAEPLSR